MNEQMWNKPAQQEEEEYIDLASLFFALLRNWWGMLLAASIMGIVFYMGARFLTTPLYQASFTAYINNSSRAGQSEMMTSSDIKAARDLTTTYSAILISPPVIEAAIEESGLSLTYDDMAKRITVSDVNDTEIIQVSVNAPDPETAYMMADAMQTVAPEYVSNIVIGSSMKTVAPAVFPTAAINVNYTKKAIIGFLLGGVLVAIGVIMHELLDNRVKSAEELEQQYGIVVIGTIHDLSATPRSGYGSYGAYGFQNGGKQ